MFAPSMGGLGKLVLPNQSKPTKLTRQLIWAGTFAVIFAFWQFWPSDVMPRPLGVWHAFENLWFNDGLAEQLAISYWTQLEALFFAGVISLILSYAASVALFRPLIILISTLRFTSLGPLVIFFTLLVSAEGHVIKLSLLLFAVTVMYVTALLPLVLEVPTEELDHAKTLHMGEWRSLWEVTILGRSDMAFDMFRQNAAMGFMMITMIEGLVRSEGGVGVMVLNDLKHFMLDSVAALVIVLFIIGFVQDLALQGVRMLAYPYAGLEKERR